ncbi:hypothetical protein BGZ68_000270, partial [Mortierella alpina]
MAALTKLVFLVAAATIAVLLAPTPVSAGGICEIKFQPDQRVRFTALKTHDMDSKGRCKLHNVCSSDLGWSLEKFFEECKRCFHYSSYSKNDGCIKITKEPYRGIGEQE